MSLQSNVVSLGFCATRRLIRVGGVLVLALVGFMGIASAQGVNGSIPVPYNSSVKRIGVAVVSDSTDLKAILQNLFNIHGAFDLAAPGAAQYTLRADLSAGGRVTIAVEPKTGGTSFTAIGTAANWHEAAYRAADEVVEKLTTVPGFFAGRLAFVSMRTKSSEIWTSDVLGLTAREETQDHSRSEFPHWSPDGTKLIYMGYYRSGFPDVIALNLVSRARTDIASYKGTNTGAIYSPDGSKIAMILSYTGTPQLYVADADGKNLHALTNTPSLKSSPTWSPDGKQIILACDPEGDPLLYQISASGGSLQRLVTSLRPYYSGDPAWNPRDPDLVAFMVEQSGGCIAVYSFKTHSSEVYDGIEGSYPCWANDGRHIFFTHLAGKQDQLYLLDTVTKKISRLTTLGASDPAFYYPAK